MCGHKGGEDEEELAVDYVEEQGRQERDDEEGDPVDDCGEGVALGVEDLSVVKPEDGAQGELEAGHENDDADNRDQVASFGVVLAP